MRPVKKRFAAVLLFVGALAAVAARPQPGTVEDAYVVTDVMVPMRDGVKLNTKILAPRGEHGPLPILFQRTPYGIAESAKRLEARLQDARRRRLHLRVPGPAREVRLGG